MKALQRSRCYGITYSNYSLCYAWPAVAGKLLIFMLHVDLLRSVTALQHLAFLCLLYLL